MSDGRKAVPLAISLDEATIQHLDQVASERGDSRSSVMRSAIRRGIECLKAGESAEPIALDGVLSKEVNDAATKIGWSREKTLIECVKVGLEPVVQANAPLRDSSGAELSPDQAEAVRFANRNYDPDSVPYGREIIKMRSRIRFLEQVVASLKQHFPESDEWIEKASKLSKMRTSGGFPFGLSIAEIDHEIAMREAHGPDPSMWPKSSPKSSKNSKGGKR